MVNHFKTNIRVKKKHFEKLKVDERIFTAQFFSLQNRLIRDVLGGNKNKFPQVFLVFVNGERFINLFIHFVAF